MADKPTSGTKKFLFERKFSTKRMLVFDWTIESGDEEEVNSTKEREERSSVLLVSEKKLKLSTSIVLVQEGQSGHKKGKILSKEEAPPVIYSTYGPRLRGFYHAFQVTFAEFGSIVQISPKEFKTAKQSKHEDLFTVTSFEYFEDKYYHCNFDRYVLSTRLWLTIDSDKLEYNTKFKLSETTFKLVQALPNQNYSCRVSKLEISELEDLSEVPAEEINKIARNCQAPLSINCLVKDHQELGTPGKTGDYYI
jgi:hypothetical protein